MKKQKPSPHELTSMPFTRGKMVVKFLEFGFSHKQTLRQDLSAERIYLDSDLRSCRQGCEEWDGDGKVATRASAWEEECSWRWGSSFWGFRAGDLKRPAGHVSGSFLLRVRKLGHFSPAPLLPWSELFPDCSPTGISVAPTPFVCKHHRA